MKHGDIRVIESGQDLALIAESRQHSRVVRLEAQELESDVFAKLIIIATRQKDRAHAAAAEQLLDSVWSETTTHPLIQRRLRRAGRVTARSGIRWKSWTRPKVRRWRIRHHSGNITNR